MATTSTTTTTTTINGSPLTQESSRGEIINQNNNQTVSDRNNITSPGIVNIFKSTTTPKEIDFDASGAQQTLNEMTSGLGYIPLVWYNKYQIAAQDIQFLSLYTDSIGPAMKLTFIDTSGLMKDKAFPLDDTKVTLFINSRSDQLKSIFIQFKIRTFTNNNGILSIDSIMDINGLYVKKFQSYSNMSSNQALQQVCKDIGLGFNTNISDTNDKMTWINSGKKPYDFIEELIDHAYISDESFIYGYIDHYYNLNFIDIQKELSRDISAELGIVSTGIGDVLRTSKIEDVSRLLLTNDASVSGSNIYFNSFRVMNNSTETSLENGYRDVLKYYDVLDKSLLNFKVDSLNNNSDSSILLKGSPLEEDFFESNQNFVYGGKIDTDNLHKNFSYTQTHNNRNIIDAQKIGLEIEMTSPNFNIYRFQKIKIVLSSNTPTPAAPMVNQRLSGDWLIVDIKYVFSDGAIRQVITLIKRELELSNEELNNEVVEKSGSGQQVGYDSGRGDYTNPVITTSTTSITTTRQPQLGRVLGTSQIPKKISFADATKSVIDNLEGGYFHPDMLLDGRVKDKRYGSSGETMYGLDRKNSPEVINCAPCKQFWAAIDKSNARKNWKNEYIPPDPLKTILMNLVVQIMEPLFNESLNKFVPEKEIQAIIRSDGRLLYNFIYAQWNGPGWFKGFSREIRSAYHNGSNTAEKLLVLFVERRVNNTGIIGNVYNNSLIAQSGKKIAKIVGVDIA